MIQRGASFSLSVSDLSRDVNRQLQGDVDFRIDEDRVVDYLLGSLAQPRRDLLRITMAVYVADRLIRRSRDGGSGRNIRLEIQVADPCLWRQRVDALEEILVRLSNDEWRIEFSDAPEPVRASLFDSSDSPVVCLYSGGLDSAGGLAARLQAGVRSVITVTARHQPGQRRQVLAQLDLLRRRFGTRIMPLFVRTTLLNSPQLKHQETSQRTRSLLFLALGAAAADVAGVSSVEIYESGVGALNLPLLAGMNVGARATHSCDLRFLDLMGALASIGTPLPVRFDLPFMALTKGEMIKSLREAGLEEVTTLTTSCVHYPLRELGPAKQCGVCPACIGRRQALAAAGIADPPERYRHDLFSADVAIPSEHQRFLRANLLQVARLGELTSVCQLPSWFVQHAHDCALATTEQELRSWTELLGRYRSEWLRLVATCRDRHVPWAALLSMPARAA